MNEAGRALELAILHELFDASDPGRLTERLEQAASSGASLAVLPELPLDRWVPLRREPCNDDAEGPNGPRQRALASAAKETGVAVLGGAIVREPDSGGRFNRALLYDGTGTLLAHYDKLHVPCEEGFWEADHYGQGTEPPQRIDGLDLPVGIQICSDLNRPAGSLMLGAQGVAAIFAPRATPAASYERWRTVIQALAVTTATYVVSINRPPEAGVNVGGPSVVAGPAGSVLVETTDPLTRVRLELSAVEQARRDYPGYLDVRPALYARGWTSLTRR